MTTLTFNQFVKELEKRVEDRGTRDMLAFMFEHIREQDRQLDTMAALLVDFANMMENYAGLSAKNNEAIREMKRGRQPDGISVQSASTDVGDGMETK